MRKKLLLTVAGLVALLVVVAVALMLFLDANRFRPQIQAQMEQALNRKVQLGNLDLSFFPTRLQAQNVQISDDPSFRAGKPFAAVDQLDVAVSLLPLLRGNVNVHSLELRRPQIELVANREGTWNFSTLGGAQPEKQPDERSGTLSLDRMNIVDARIAVTDLAKSPQPDVYDHLNLRLEDTRIASSPDRMSVVGSITLENARVRGVELGYPITLDYDVVNDAAASLITVNKADLKLGATPISLAGTINTQPNPAQVDLKTTASDVSIAEVARLASAMGIAFAPGTTVNGKLFADVQVKGSSEAPAFSGTIRAREIQGTGEDIPVPVSIPAVDIALSPREIRSNNFNVVAGGTTAQTQFAVRNYTSETPLVEFSARAPNAALPELLSIARAYGVSGLDRISGQGTLNLDMRASGPVSSVAKTDTLLRAVNGNLDLNFANVKLAGTDLNYQLSSIGGFLKPGQKNQGYTNILKVTGNIPVKNGVAQTNNLQVITDIGNLAATGTANLASKALDLDVTAVISKDVSSQLGGTSVGGYLNTVLANSNGELVIPINVTGTFENPRFAPDAKRMAQMRVKGLLPSFDNPASGAAGILGGLLGGKKSGDQAQPEKPANPVGDVLEGLFGGKKKQSK